jgi:hypothetical protein
MTPTSPAVVPLAAVIGLFRDRSFAAGVAIGLSYFAGFIGLIFRPLSLRRQLGLGSRPALTAGLMSQPRTRRHDDDGKLPRDAARSVELRDDPDSFRAQRAPRPWWRPHVPTGCVG